MWVRTPTNDLCNLSHARRITLDHDPVAKRHEVRAWFAGDDLPVVLADYERKEDAVLHMRGLVLLTGAKKCELSRGES